MNKYLNQDFLDRRMNRIKKRYKMNIEKG